MLENRDKSANSRVSGERDQRLTGKSGAGDTQHFPSEPTDLEGIERLLVTLG